MSFEDRLNDELEPLPDDDTFAEVRRFTYPLEEDLEEIVEDVLADLEQYDNTNSIWYLPHAELTQIEISIKSKINAVIHFAKQDPGKTAAIELEHFPYHITAQQATSDGRDILNVTLEEIG